MCWVSAGGCEGYTRVSPANKEMEILPYCVCCCVRGISHSFQLCSITHKDKVGQSSSSRLFYSLFLGEEGRQSAAEQEDQEAGESPGQEEAGDSAAGAEEERAAGPDLHWAAGRGGQAGGEAGPAERE